MSSAKDHDTIAMPLGSKCQRIVRLRDGWMVWTATTDYQLGTYLLLCDTGEVLRVTARDGEGDDYFMIRPADHVIEENDNETSSASVDYTESRH